MYHSNTPSWLSRSQITRGQPFGSEALVIQAAQQGDQDAFSFLVEQYQQAAQRIARQIMRTEEAAADAVQDALMKAYRAINRYEEGNFAAWLMRIVTNTCYDHLRYYRRRPAQSLDELIATSGVESISPQGHQNVESKVVEQEQLETLLQMIDRLPSWHRDVIVMVDVHGYNYGETSQALGLPLGTVKSRLSRARMNLRDQIVAAGMAPERYGQ